MRFSMLYSGEQILSFKSCLVFYAGDSLNHYLNNYHSSTYTFFNILILHHVLAADTLKILCEKYNYMYTGQALVHLHPLACLVFHSLLDQSQIRQLS